MVQNPRQRINTISPESADKEEVCDSMVVGHCCGCILAGKRQERAEKTSGKDVNMKKNVQKSEPQREVAIATPYESRSQPLPEGGNFDFSKSRLDDYLTTPPTPTPSPKPKPPPPKLLWTFEDVVKKISFQVPEVTQFKDSPCVKLLLEKAYHRELKINDAVDLIWDECYELLKRPSPKKLADPPEVEVSQKGVKKEKLVVQPKLSISPIAPVPAIQQKAPTPTPQPPKKRYASFSSKRKSKSRKANAGKSRVPPAATARPSHPFIFLGRAHAPTAYTPPWMKRFVERKSKPPDL